MNERRVTDEMWRRVREDRDVLDRVADRIGRARKLITEIESEEVMGIELFTNWKDITELRSRTFEILEAAGATRAIVMAQPALNKPALADRVRTFAAECSAKGIAVSLCTGPAVIEYAAPLQIRDRLAALCRDTGATPMLDAEPVHVKRPNEQRWSPERVKPWLDVPEMQITTTRFEAPRIGAHARVTYAQLEGQTSTDTLAQALQIFCRYTPMERIVITLGSFDSEGDKRTLDEVKRDLERCTAQAKLSGRLAMFVAQTTSLAEAEAMRSWAEKVWP